MNPNEFRTGVIRPVECFKEGWELIKPDFWLLFAITLLAMLIGGITMYILLGAMLCGMFYCYLERVDGNPVSLDGLWKGFQWWLPGLLVAAVMIIPVVIVYLILYVPLVMAMIMGSKLSESELAALLGTAFAVDLVVIVIMVCFHTLLILSFPLIVDRGLGAFGAMALSARAVWGNLKGVAGLYGVAFLLNLAGMAAFCVGVYFVVPIIIAGNVVAYRKLFPRTSISNEPPSPASFHGAGEPA